jgi:hypothetical protein
MTYSLNPYSLGKETFLFAANMANGTICGDIDRVARHR